jgi:hypothetical protein
LEFSVRMSFKAAIRSMSASSEQRDYYNIGSILVAN